MFTKSFNDYKNDDRPFLVRRGLLKDKNFLFDRDTVKFKFDSTLNIIKQDAFLTHKKSTKSLFIDFNKIVEGQISRFIEIGILGFQIYKNKNIIKIYPRVCPHEGGDLDVNNEVGVKYTLDNF